MIHPKFYKYTLLFNLILCGGIFLPIVGKIENGTQRYLIYDIIQSPAFFIKSIVHSKFINVEDLTIWNSFGYVGPILNLISCSVWIFLIQTIIKRIRPKSYTTTYSTQFWKKVYLLNLIIAVAMFIVWLPMSDSFIRGVSNNPFSNLQLIFLFPLTALGYITEIIGSVFLETGGDTAFGFSDTELLSKITSSFGVTCFCLLIIWVRSLYMYSQKQRVK